MRACLTSGRPAALCGLGGVGKTQTALEYAYRHAPDYELVWWVAAEEPSTLGRDLEALALRLGLVEREDHDQAAAAAAVRRWLEGHAGWLLVFDNATDPADLGEALPRGGGHVIITSRHADWARVGSLAVEPFAREESLTFLARRAGDEPAAGEGATRETADPAAADLAELLGDLPLALEQAAASHHEDTGQWGPTRRRRTSFECRKWIGQLLEDARCADRGAALPARSSVHDGAGLLVERLLGG